MRIDKFLKNSRLIKRRTTAKKACEAGRILLNDRLAKPGSIVSVGDIIQINFSEHSFKCKVLLLSESQKKEDASLMYEEIL